MKRLVLERHVFGPPLSAYETAWDALGWSAGLAGERADRLAESVPWGSALAKAADPPRLRGPLAEITGEPNLDRLRFALLPAEGGWAFSVWGATERRSEHEWQVLTHTILLDDAAFRMLAGNPFHLLERGAARRGWLHELAEGEPFRTRRMIEPVTLDDDGRLGQRAEAHRLKEVERLRTRLAADGVRVHDGVTAIWEALAVRTAGCVVLPATPLAGRLARLAWLSLPLEDRAAVPFTTGQATSGRMAAALAVLEMEWGDAVPERARPVAHSPAGEPSRGHALWATSLDHRALHRSYSARARARRWSLLGGDVDAAARTMEWSARWSTRQDRETAIELVRSEARERSGRTAAAGYVLGRALRGRERDASARADAALETVAAETDGASVHVVRGVVRGLLNSKSTDDRLAAALVRLRAPVRRPPLAPAPELRRLATQEKTALEILPGHPAAGREIACAASQTGAPAVLLVPALVAALAATRDPDALARDGGAWLVARGMPAALAEAVERYEGAAQPVLRALLPEAAAVAPLEPESEAALLHMAWSEWCVRGRTSLEEFGHDDPDAAFALLAQLLGASIPMPLFLRVRRTLLEAASHGVRRPVPSRAAAASPALNEVVAARASQPPLVLIEGV